MTFSFNSDCEKSTASEPTMLQTKPIQYYYMVYVVVAPPGACCFFTHKDHYQRFPAGYNRRSKCYIIHLMRMSITLPG